MQKRITKILLLALLTFGFNPAMSMATTIATSQSLGNFDRVLFTGNSPQQLRVESNGTKVDLYLSSPTGDVGMITAKLRPRIVSAIRSADGKHIAITLDKPYRVRQFVSGNSVGVDILKTEQQTTPSPFTTTKVEQQAQSQPLLSTKPAVAPIAPPAAVPAPTPAPVAVPKPEAKPSIMTTKEEPVPTPPAAPAAQQPAPKPPSIMTTKEEPPAPAPEPKPEPAPVAEVKPATPELPAPSKADEAFFDEEVDEATTPETPTATEVPQTEEPKVDVPVTTRSFISEDIIVGVRNEKEGAALDFPWTERVATAVFQRGRDIWIVFNKESRLDTLRLRTVLPTSVLNVTRYKMPGNTVIKLETDGSVNAAVEAQKASYGWTVRLVPGPVHALKDTPVQSNATHSRPHLMFQVFDIGNPFSFYDPAIGDRWLVAPTYEAGLGIDNPRSYPSFDVVPSVQGIAVLTQRPEIKFEQTRTGLRLTSDKGLNISKDLPYLASNSAPVKGASATSNVMLPYDRWYIEPGTFFNVRAALTEEISAAPLSMRAELYTRLATLYLGQGFGLEAASLLSLVKQIAPEYYVEKKLALINAAANFMAHRMEDAATEIKAPELASMKETELWKDAIGLYVPLDARVTGVVVGQGEPAGEPADESKMSESEKQKRTEEELKQIAMNAAIASKGFDYLAYNSQFIQFYPPAMRQRLAVLAADAYIDRSKYGRAVSVFDGLNKEGLLEPIDMQAEYMMGRIAAERGKSDEARKAWERLANQEQDDMVRAQAAFALVSMDYTEGKIKLPEAITKIDALRIAWRGDEHERELLDYLAQLYMDNKQFDMALRVWKELINNFPNDPEIIHITTRTSELFERLFYDGLADELPPLKSLALFYEFRELTPVGDKGNIIIQKLADRLAAVDLIDRAAQLLEHQVKFRLAGEDRARVGARLALLYLIDRKPEQALDILEITNYGDMNDQLRLQRLRLSAQAFAALDRYEEALAIITADQTEKGQLLRMDVLWQMKDWANVINQGEDMMAARKDLTAPLTEQETEILLKLALAYSFEKDFTQLNYLRDYYTSLMAESPYKDIFSYITNNTSPIDPEDFALVAQQISRTESFMKEFRDKISKGKLSETVN